MEITITLTNAQAVAARKLALTAKRNKGLSAEDFATKLLNSVLTSRYEPLHKAMKQLEMARYDSAIEMGASIAESKSEYVSRIMEESADILEDLKNFDISE